MATLLIFIKNPEKGKVKTRLAQGVGEERALAIYWALLGHTRQIAEAIDAHRLLFYSSFIEQEDDWSPTAFDKRLQEGADLGERMKRAFATAFTEGGPAVIIGSDCAQLTPAIVVEAYRQLEQHDFVLGPAEDGGYYLLGMRTYMPSVFDDMAWSTDQVLPQTLAHIKENNWSVSLLPTLSDIDFQEDWEKHGWEIS